MGGTVANKALIPENARRLHIADENNKQQAGTTSTPARLFDSNHQAIRTITSNYDRRQPIIASPANHSSLTIDIDASISHSRAQPSRTTRYSSSTTTSHSLQHQTERQGGQFMRLIMPKLISISLPKLFIHGHFIVVHGPKHQKTHQLTAVCTQLRSRQQAVRSFRPQNPRILQERLARQQKA